MAVASLSVEKKKLDNPPLQLHRLGDRTLRQIAKRVARVDDEVRGLIRTMLQTMYSSDGIGLAAPQVGISKQVIVIDCEPEEATAPPLVLINPVIKHQSSDQVLTQEGCLSIPGVFLDVRRPATVEVAYKDENGRPRRLEAKGFLACAIQHEMDHLNGILFVDRVESFLIRDRELADHGFSTQAVKPIM